MAYFYCRNRFCRCFKRDIHFLSLHTKVPSVHMCVFISVSTYFFMMTSFFPPCSSRKEYWALFFLFKSIPFFVFLLVLAFLLFLAIEQISYSTTGTRFKIQSKIMLKLAGYWRHVRHFTMPKDTMKKSTYHG